MVTSTTSTLIAVAWRQPTCWWWSFGDPPKTLWIHGTGLLTYIYRVDVYCKCIGRYHVNPMANDVQTSLVLGYIQARELYCPLLGCSKDSYVSCTYMLHITYSIVIFFPVTSSSGSNLRNTKDGSCNCKFFGSSHIFSVSVSMERCWDVWGSCWYSNTPVALSLNV